MIGEQSFAYHRAVAPMLWVLVGLSTIELVVVHLLVSLWNGRLAAFLSLLSLAALIWLVSAIRSMRRLPVLLDDERLLMRVGTLRRVEVPLAAIAGLRASWTAAAVKAQGVANLALIAYPNVMIDLLSPVPGRRRPVVAVAHRLDDPERFAHALADALSRRPVGA